MKLYHATSSPAIAFKIAEEGFRGSDVWDYKDVIFLADRPLHGFGGWREAWVAVDVPDELLSQGEYPEAEWDNEQYHAKCFCFKAEVINQYPREVILA